MAEGKNRRAADWFSRITLTAFLFVVIGGGLFARDVYHDYRAAFGGSAYPRGVNDRVKSDSTKDGKPSPAPNDAVGEARAEWGQFGDFFGGTLNPIFGFVSVIALFLTILYQSRELKLSTEELQKSAEALEAQNAAIEHQRFEQTFFAWLETYRELLGTVEHTISRRTKSNDEILLEYRGRRALKVWYGESINESRMLAAIRKITGDPEWERLNVGYEKERLADKIARLSNLGWHSEISKTALHSWGELYDREEYQLDSLFRVLYRLIKWIDDQPADRLSWEEKWLYVSVVRSQLSWIEMAFLYFNGMTERGKNFKLYINRYALFDNLNTERDWRLAILRDRPVDSVGYANSAYSSDAARAAQWGQLKAN